ncbi:hypothetical protein [Pantoea piersonii]|uniref:hypothetical protein n=1 Tax=Pantoea piersonii TaxID=2364647 RepID=UPI002898C578|nr:hypothetical protein [Pantoea piersonii]
MVNGLPAGIVEVFDRMLFTAWEASRSTIELDIDWPEANDDYWKDGEEGAYARGHEDGKDKTSLAVRKALNDAGLKVKL